MLGAVSVTAEHPGATEGPKDIAVTMMLQPYPQEADIQTGRNG